VSKSGLDIRLHDCSAALTKGLG